MFQFFWLSVLRALLNGYILYKCLGKCTVLDIQCLILMSAILYQEIILLNGGCNISVSDLFANIPIWYTLPLDLKNGWQIISAKKSFAVYAATRTEKAEWMAHINKCIQDLLAKS